MRYSRKFILSLLCFLLICASFGWSAGNISAAVLSWTKVNDPIYNLNTSSPNLTSVAYGGGKYVAVGNNGSVTSSSDGITWSTGNLIVTSHLRGVAYGNNVYVAVGEGGTIIKSSDAKTWSTANSGTTNYFYNVKFLDGKFWATAAAGLVKTSSDGITWSVVNGFVGKTSSAIISIGYGGGKYVIGDIAGKIYDSADGITWSGGRAILGSTSSINFMEYLNGQFYTTAGNVSYRSADATTWSTNGTGGTIVGAAFGNSKYVLMGYTEDLYTSTDGNTFTLQTRKGNGTMNAVTFANGKFVAVGAGGIIGYSTDGLSWKVATPMLKDMLYNNNGLYVAVGANDTNLAFAEGRIMTSADLVTWTDRLTTATGFSFAGVAYDGQTYVAVGKSGSIYKSSDAVSWSAVTSNTTVNLWGVKYVNDRFIALGDSGTLVTSPNGATWSKQTTPLYSSVLYSAAYGAGKYVIVGSRTNDNQIAYSTDATSWTTVSIPTTSSAIEFFSVIYANDLFIAGGRNGILYTSPDGVNWTSRTPAGTNKDIRALAYGAGQIVTAGGEGQIFSSATGLTWNAETSSVGANYLVSVLHDGTRFVALGNYSTIIAASTVSPSITSHPTNATINVGGNATFTAAADHALSYQWQVKQAPSTSFVNLSNNAIYSGSTTAALNVAGATSGMNGNEYRLVVKGAAASEAISNVATLTVETPVTVPGAPTGVTAVARDGKAEISFTSPASNGGSAITLYTVTASPGGASATGAGSPITVTGLTNGTSYTFKVVATNSVGDSAASASSASVTPAAAVTVPGAPTGVTAVARDGKAEISFTSPASNGGSAITLYTVTASPGGASATGAGSPITVTGLTNGTSYTFKVVATNSVGDSAASASSASVTPAAAVTVPGVPTGVTAVAGNGEAEISFTPPASNGGSTITLYTVTASPGGASATGAVSPITVTGLANGTAYTFKVVATNGVGDSAASASSASVTPTAAVTVPGVPTGVTAVAGNGEAEISFTPPTSNGGSAITLYTVTASPGGASATGLVSPITVTGLTNGTSYTFKVVATNSVGDSAASVPSLSVTPTAAVTVPGVPTGVTAVAGNGEAEISFTPPTSNGGSAITLYTVTASPGGASATGAVSPITVTGLANGTPYTFKVVATNSAGDSLASASSLSVTPTAAVTVPGVPTGVTAVAGNGEAEISFTPPTSNGGSAITLYTVTASPGGASATGLVSPITVPGLTNGTPYTFKVVATNSAGDSASSVPSLSVTPAAAVTAPSVPTGVTAVAGDGKAEISFTPPTSNGGSAITLYKVTASPGGASATGIASPITVPGLANGTPYTFTVVATNSAGDSASSASSLSVTPAAAVTTPPSSPQSTPTPQPTPLPEAADSGIDVWVNGKAEKAGKATTTKVNGQSVMTVAVDQKKLEDKLAAEGQGAVVTILVSSKSDVFVAELNGQMVKNMENNQAILEIKTDQATYTLPARQINIDSISDQVGKTVALQDIKIQVEIAAPTAETVKLAENAAMKANVTLVPPLIDFTVKGKYGDTIVEVSKFNAYVERTIAIPDGVDPNKITTGVVIDQDGTVRHVPTRITVTSGKYYAVINSLTNSTYSVVWHPLDFEDVANHWAKNAVNDMGSRMVVSGIGNEIFSPDQDITRAEFAAILVRGLGLKLDNGAAPFLDVKASDWYNGAINTAYSYHLINGFEDGTFRPSDKITREQAMVILAKAMTITNLKTKLPVQSTEVTLNPYSDAAKVSSWAQSGVADSVHAGIVSGRSSTGLAPKAYMTRAEVATVVQRLLQKSGLI